MRAGAETWRVQEKQEQTNVPSNAEKKKKERKKKSMQLASRCCREDAQSEKSDTWAKHADHVRGGDEEEEIERKNRKVGNRSAAGKHVDDVSVHSAEAVITAGTDDVALGGPKGPRRFRRPLFFLSAQSTRHPTYLSQGAICLPRGRRTASTVDGENRAGSFSVADKRYQSASDWLALLSCIRFHTHARQRRINTPNAFTDRRLYLVFFAHVLFIYIFTATAIEMLSHCIRSGFQK